MTHADYGHPQARSRRLQRTRRGGSVRQAEWIEVENAYLEELYAEIAQLKALIESMVAADAPNSREAAAQLGLRGVLSRGPGQARVGRLRATCRAL